MPETTCDCSDEYGPCEDHSELFVMREGAAVRTADELLAVFVADATDLLASDLCDDEDRAAARRALDDANAAAAAYWEATDNAGGWAPYDPDEPSSLAEWLSDAAYQLEGCLPFSVYWDDGYRIIRTIGGPLTDEANR